MAMGELLTAFVSGGVAALIVGGAGFGGMGITAAALIVGVGGYYLASVVS